MPNYVPKSLLIEIYLNLLRNLENPKRASAKNTVVLEYEVDQLSCQHLKKTDLPISCLSADKCLVIRSFFHILPFGLGLGHPPLGNWDKLGLSGFFGLLGLLISVCLLG